jgi:hypothetical protein
LKLLFPIITFFGYCSVLYAITGLNAIVINQQNLQPNVYFFGICAYIGYSSASNLKKRASLLGGFASDLIEIENLVCLKKPIEIIYNSLAEKSELFKELKQNGEIENALQNITYLKSEDKEIIRTIFSTLGQAMVICNVTTLNKQGPEL